MNDKVKKPRLFYFEETENCWTPAPDMVENIVSTDLMDDNDTIEITFKRIDMTDEEFNNLPEG